jgi:hypothetical protein
VRFSSAGRQSIERTQDMPAEVHTLRPRAPACRPRVVEALSEQLIDYLTGDGSMSPDALHRCLMRGGLAPTGDEKVMALRVAIACACLRDDYPPEIGGAA